MKCHDCDRSADIPVEKDGIKLWICERHLRERFKNLAEAELHEELQSDSE